MTELRSLAVAQTCAVSGDVEANLAEHLRLIEIAASAGARVVVFPELSLTGYELGRARELAFSEDDERLVPLSAAAASHSLTLVVGAPVRRGAALHIGAFIIRPDRTTALYTKRHLGAFAASASRDGIVPPAERTVFQPGELDPLIQLDDEFAAVAVCADVGQPSHPQQAAARGARTYLASMFVIPSELAGEVTRLKSYAVRHALVVAMANFGSPTGGLRSAGRSSIWSETGELLAQLDETGAGVAVVTETPRGWCASTVMLRDLTTAPAA